MSNMEGLLGLRRGARLLVLWMLILAGSGRVDADWWEQPHDKWYLKDDWKGALVASYSPVFRLLAPATNGWIVIWGENGVNLRINGKPAMRHVDRGLIYDMDLTPLIAGALEVRIESGQGRVVAEGELVDEKGNRYPFASGCDWQGPASPGKSFPPASKPYRPGESSGAFHSAHNGLLMRYNDEERGKTEISRSLARIQMLREQSIFLLRRYRPAEEILSFSPDTPWRRAEAFARERMDQVERLLKEQAVPAQKQGRSAEAIALAAKANESLGLAEDAVGCARRLYEEERQLNHTRTMAALLKWVGTNTPPMDAEAKKIEDRLATARTFIGQGEWSEAREGIDAAALETGAIGERLEALGAGHLGKPDEFPEDRFGWLNTPALMGNDPSLWEFSIVNPRANWIDLRGMWAFRIDPPNEGEKLGWHKPDTSTEGWRLLRVPREWEREDVRDENDNSPWDCPYKLTDLRCDDKPYNGYAWYRRHVRLPEAWSGRRVVLRVEKVADWLRVFVNGQVAGEPRRGGGAFALPGEALLFGRTNTIALQVYNHDNFGGLVGGPVSLAVDDAQPEHVTTPGPMAFTTEWTVKTAGGQERMTTFASAMSPAVVCVLDQPVFRLWGWEAKGFTPPKMLSFVVSTGKQDVALSESRLVLDGAALNDSWLLLTGSTEGADRGTAAARPAILMLEKRPQTIAWRTNELGFMGLEIAFDSPGGRVVVFNLPLPAEPWSPRDLAVRSSTMRAVPVMCSELAQLDKAALSGKFCLAYKYMDIVDFRGARPSRLAPAPMLLSYGLKHRFPGLKAVGATATSYSSEHAPYRVRMGSEAWIYWTPLVDKSKLIKGVGELFAKRRPEDNARGGNTEQQMFDDWRAWGFDHARYAFAWNQDWDIPLQNKLGGPISDDPKLWERMDYLVKQHTDRGIMAMLCYFFNEDTPQRDTRNLVRNSTRYWLAHPETRTNCYELWRRIAQRYADCPDGLVAYDFFNEPAYMHREDWNKIIKDLTGIVRSVDKKHLIVCEAGDGWSQPQWFNWLEPTGDTNTIYSFHHYGKHWGYHYDEHYPGYKALPEKEMGILLEAILFGIRHNVPLHCGEFGVSMISPGEDHLRWLDDYLALLERFGIGWNWWNWSGTDIYRTGLKAGDETSSNLPVLRKWIERKKAWHK